MGSRSYTFPRTRGHLPDSWACEAPHAAHSEASQPGEQSVSCLLGGRREEPTKYHDNRTAGANFVRRTRAQSNVERSPVPGGRHDGGFPLPHQHGLDVRTGAVHTAPMPASSHALGPKDKMRGDSGAMTAPYSFRYGNNWTGWARFGWTSGTVDKGSNPEPTFPRFECQDSKVAAGPGQAGSQSFFITRNRPSNHPDGLVGGSVAGSVGGKGGRGRCVSSHLLNAALQIECVRVGLI